MIEHKKNINRNNKNRFYLFLFCGNWELKTKFSRRVAQSHPSATWHLKQRSCGTLRSKVLNVRLFTLKKAVTLHAKNKKGC